jgi:hypothetical protein
VISWVRSGGLKRSRVWDDEGVGSSLLTTGWCLYNVIVA